MMIRKVLMLTVLPAAVLIGCSDESAHPNDQRRAQADALCREKWGKGLDELPVDNLVLISPHNEDIKNEYTWAFSLHYAVEYGRQVEIVWRDVSGGTGRVNQYIRNTCYDGQNRAGVDVLWGGGEFVFKKLAADGFLRPMDLPADITDNIPLNFSGQAIRDERNRWVGSALSGFGFIYNKTMLEKCGLQPPQQWDDLATPRFAGLLALADPTASGSAAAAYRMVVVSGQDWPSGWAKLLRILANAGLFTDSAGSAANAPALGEALVATCIDFYGTTRVAEAPDELAYVSPRGQTTYGADPIGMLIDPPNPEPAERFVEFVLSRRGQALWALKVGDPHGPARTPLGRLPIRPDVYGHYAARLSPWVENPFEGGRALQPSPQMQKVNFSVLQQLVHAAALQNPEALRQARDALIRSGFDEELLAEFNRLPEEISTLEKIDEVAEMLGDDRRLERLQTNWRDFFAAKYRRIIEAAP
ncbi:MAG: ABC transporter substrate-binding protein [Phycisphaerae bacterium]